MKTNLLIIFSALIAIPCFSQNANLEYKNAVKVYNLTTIDRHYTPQFPDSIDNGYSNTYTNIQILHPTIAWQWRNAKGNAHEIELTSFRMGTSETANQNNLSTNPRPFTPPVYDHTGTVISVRYEYIFILKQEHDAKLVPALGLGFNPYYILDMYKPNISSEFPYSVQSIGARFFAIPRLNYFLSERFFVDLNFPVSIHDAKMVFSKTEDPGFPIQDRKSNSIETESFSPIFSARIGIGLKI